MLQNNSLTIRDYLSTNVINQHDNKLLTVTPVRKTLPERSFINQALLSKVRAGDAQVQFQLGMITPREEKVGFAKLFFELASTNGHILARRYLDVFHNVGLSIALWRTAVLALHGQLV